MISSTSDPVPSGEPSSTISISSRASCASAFAMRRPTFSRSLYVGTMTSARSATPSPIRQQASQRQEHSHSGGEEGHDRARTKALVREAQLDRPCPGAERDADEGEIGAGDGRGPSVHGGPPTRVVVLRDDE